MLFEQSEINSYLLSFAEIIFIEALSSAFSLLDIAKIIFVPPNGTLPVLFRSKLSAALVFHFPRIDLADIKLAILAIGFRPASDSLFSVGEDRFTSLSFFPSSPFFSGVLTFAFDTAKNQLRNGQIDYVMMTSYPT